jgi:hypothetical protein
MGHYIDLVHRWLSEQSDLCWIWFKRFCGVMGSFGLTQWFLVLGVVIVFAFFCLKGYGSRSSY